MQTDFEKKLKKILQITKLNYKYQRSYKSLKNKGKNYKYKKIKVTEIEIKLICLIIVLVRKLLSYGFYRSHQKIAVN